MSYKTKEERAIKTGHGKCGKCATFKWVVTTAFDSKVSGREYLQSGKCSFHKVGDDDEAFVSAEDSCSYYEDIKNDN